MKTKYFEYNRNGGSEKYSEFTEEEYLKAKEDENRWFISFGDSVWDFKAFLIPHAVMKRTEQHVCIPDIPHTAVAWMVCRQNAYSRRDLDSVISFYMPWFFFYIFHCFFTSKISLSIM